MSLYAYMQEVEAFEALQSTKIQHSMCNLKKNQKTYDGLQNLHS